MANHLETNPHFTLPHERREGRPLPAEPPAFLGELPSRTTQLPQLPMDPPPLTRQSRKTRGQRRADDRTGDRTTESDYFYSPWQPPPPPPSSDRQQPELQLQPPPRRDRSGEVTEPNPLPQETSEDRLPQFAQPSGEHRIKRSGASSTGRRKDGHGSLWAPPPHRTTPLTWFGAVFCAIFSIIIFLGGLIVLIVYIVYRPRSPRFDISDVTLNVAYLDDGSLLNADVTMYANFTNPNKMGVDLRNVILDLYFEETLIATQYIIPFKIGRRSSSFAYIHMITSQVPLNPKERRKLEDEVARNALIFQVRGFFKVRSHLASFIKYSYTLHGHCSFMVSAPPSGITRAVRCRSKRRDFSSFHIT